DGVASVTDAALQAIRRLFRSAVHGSHAIADGSCRRSAATGSGLTLARQLGGPTVGTTVGEVQPRENAFRGALDARAGGFDRGDRLVPATRPRSDVSEGPLTGVDAQGVADHE